MRGAVSAGCKKLTEISPFLVNYPLRNRLMALVVIPRIVVFAIFAGMQGPLAGGAGGPKLDSFACIDVLTAIPALHVHRAIFPSGIP